MYDDLSLLIIDGTSLMKNAINLTEINMQIKITNIHQIYAIVLRLSDEIWYRKKEIRDLQKIANSLELTDKDDIDTLKNINTY